MSTFCTVSLQIVEKYSPDEVAGVVAEVCKVLAAVPSSRDCRRVWCLFCAVGAYQHLHPVFGLIGALGGLFLRQCCEPVAMVQVEDSHPLG